MAVSGLRRANSPRPLTSARAQLNVARAYEALGDRGQAMDYYKRAIQSAPSDHDAAPGVSEQAQQALARLTAR